MTATTLKSPTTGKTLIPVASRTTTPANDNTPKTVEFPREYIEVIVSDSRVWSRGSQWGHVAVVVNATVYSRAHEEYITTTKDAYLHGGATMTSHGADRMKGNGYRDNAGIVLWVSPRERKVIEDELNRRVEADHAFKRKHPNDSSYSVFSNSCSSNVADVLELIGILAHDPRWLPFAVTPAELLAVLTKSNRFVKKNMYPKSE